MINVIQMDCPFCPSPVFAESLEYTTLCELHSGDVCWYCKKDIDNLVTNNNGVHVDCAVTFRNQLCLRLGENYYQKCIVCGGDGLRLCAEHQKEGFCTICGCGQCTDLCIELDRMWNKFTWRMTDDFKVHEYCLNNKREIDALKDNKREIGELKERITELEGIVRDLLNIVKNC